MEYSPEHDALPFFPCGKTTLYKCVCSVSILLSVICCCSSKDCDGFRSGVAVIPGHGNVTAALMAMKDSYAGCTRIGNNLLITSLGESVANTTFLDEITEVLGSVIIFGNNATTITLPKLTAVRGQQQFQLSSDQMANYSFIVQQNLNLAVLRMPKLNAIAAGAVFIADNPKWCWPTTIPWIDITAGKNVTVLHQSGKGQQCSCNAKCSAGCWGPSEMDCYTETFLGCSKMNCSHRCKKDIAVCCAMECEAGCSGPLDTDCYVCRHFNNTHQCVRTCSLLVKESNTTSTFKPSPSIRYEDGVDCVSSCGLGKFSLGQKCVERCPDGFQPDSNNKCHNCSEWANDSFCCLGTNKLLGGPYLSIKHLQEFYSKSPCVVIDGDVAMYRYSFEPMHPAGKSGFPIPPVIRSFSDLDPLRSVHHVTGCVIIIGFPWQNLTFFENVETIGSCSTLPPGISSPPFSLYGLQVGSSDSLKFLGLGSLQSVAGAVFLHTLRHLCFVHSFRWWSSTKNISQINQVFFADIPKQSACGENYTCDLECANDTGCLGPRDNDCQSCSRAEYRGHCTSNCTAAAKSYGNGELQYLNSTTGRCSDCHYTCAGGCRGATRQDCFRCKQYVLWDGSCVEECPKGLTVEGNSTRCTPNHTATQTQFERPTSSLPRTRITPTGGATTSNESLPSCNETNLFVLNNQTVCIPQCPAKTYLMFMKKSLGQASSSGQPSWKECVPCNEQCAANCTGPGSSVHACNGQCLNFFENSVCVEKCQEDLAAGDDRVCKSQPTPPSNKADDLNVAALVSGSLSGIAIVIIAVIALHNRLQLVKYWRSRHVKHAEVEAACGHGQGQSTDVVANSVIEREETSLTSPHATSTPLLPEWREMRLADIRNPLFPNLARTRWPFSRRWRDIFRQLPAVKTTEDSLRWSGLPRAYKYPEPEMDSIQTCIRRQGHQMEDSECLQQALNNWIDDSGGHAKVGHLFDVLASNTVNLSGVADEFFQDYFKNHHIH